MNGFDLKSLMLQLINGSLLLCTSLSCLWPGWLRQSGLQELMNMNSTLLITLVLFAAFIAGVLIDYFADLGESFLVNRGWVTPPSFYLLTQGKCRGIELAHAAYIQKMLSELACRLTINNELSPQYFVDKKQANLLFQVAKHKTFSDARPMRMELINSFFVLYIFTRNLALTLAICAVLCVLTGFIAAGALTGLMALLFLPASYRYAIYYARIILGSSFNIVENAETSAP